MGATHRTRQYLHLEVSDALRSRINDRETPPGTILQSEHGLSQEFGVSRSVIRQALRTLAQEGEVHVVPGRGTVVAERPEWHRDAQRTAGLSAQMRLMGARVSTRVLSYCVQTAGDRAARLGSTDALVLERLRLLDGEPVAYIRTWLPAWVAGKVARTDLEDSSLHHQLHNNAGVDVQGGPRQIRAVSAGPEMASGLQIKPGDPVLLLEGESYDETGRVIELFSTWHRSDRVALDIAIIDPVTRPTEQVLRPSRTEATTSEAAGSPSLQMAEETASETLRIIKALRRGEGAS